MDHRLIIDGNAVYEIDQDCVRRYRERQETQGTGRGGKADGYQQAPGNRGYERGR